jgi:DNA invertase Pin-like site-specific DNA recombinase
MQPYFLVLPTFVPRTRASSTRQDATSHSFHGTTVKHVLDAGATIRALDFPSIDLTTPEGRGFLAMFSAMTERERTRIVERTREGRRLAMSNGVKMGPPFKLTEHQRQLAAKRMAAGESTRQMARDFNVSHNTIARLR